MGRRGARNINAGAMFVGSDSNSPEAPGVHDSLSGIAGESRRIVATAPSPPWVLQYSGKFFAAPSLYLVLFGEHLSGQFFFHQSANLL